MEETAGKLDGDDFLTLLHIGMEMENEGLKETNSYKRLEKFLIDRSPLKKRENHTTI